jgi:hypothetical protein
MMRKSWWVAVAIAGLAGCTETDPEKINNNVPPPSKNPVAQAGGGASFTPGGGSSTQYPSSYPGMDKAKDAKPADSAKAEAKPAGGEVTLSEDEVAEVNKLPEPDRAAALAQKLCPVGSFESTAEGHLGSMGIPVKTVVKGQTVFTCCKSCLKSLEKDPDKYLANLKK